MNKCLHCNQTTNNPKYCSLSCGAKAQTRTRASRIINCLECNKEIETIGTPNKKFCNRSCSASYNNRVNPKRSTFEKAKANCEKVCEHCSGKLKRADRALRFCSSKCYNLSQAARNVEVWLETGLTVGSAFPTGHYVREYIRSDQNNKCSICQCNPQHNELPLVFVLDHIDGNASNNVRSNLRLVCPNCDSQLDTYKSKNKGNGRFARRQRYADGKSS